MESNDSFNEQFKPKKAEKNEDDQLHGNDVDGSQQRREEHDSHRFSAITRDLREIG